MTLSGFAQGAFERKQALLGDKTAFAAVAAKPTARQHAMTGNDDRDRVFAAGAADRAGRRADCTSEIAVRSGLAVRNGLHRRPDPLLERRSRRRQRQVEIRELAGEISVKIERRLSEQRTTVTQPVFAPGNHADLDFFYLTRPCHDPACN